MSRVHRLQTTDRIFFVTVNLLRTAAPITGAEFAQIVEGFATSRRKLNFLLHGYVVMPDHWHALISTSYPLTISRVVQDIKWNSSRTLNRSRSTTGSIWQRQFWDRFVRHAKELSQRFDCIHLNPVRKGLVAEAKNWRWSSFNNFALNKEIVETCPIQVDYVHLPESYRG